MKRKIFDGKSGLNRFMFNKMLEALDNKSRYRRTDPVKLVKLSGIRPGQKVLEIGCGAGFFTPAIAVSAGEKGFVNSIDLHPSAVEKTAEKMTGAGAVNVSVSRADAHSTGFEKDCFDLIILYGVVPAPVISEKELGRELLRILKPGGAIAVWTLSPFWTPRTIMKSSHLIYSGKTEGVHILRKAAA